ncbi:MAG: GyrI-like domain-containing protein [Ferruginibacter sp.]
MMKKWLFVLLAGMLFSVLAVYIVIPNTISLRASLLIKATRPGIHRMLSDKNSVARWWPGKVSNGGFYFNGRTYQITSGNITVLPIAVNTKKYELNTSLFLISFTTDSTKMGWVGSLTTSYNPFDRFRSYLEAKKIQKDMKIILQTMDTFYSKPENIYGIRIKNHLITDSILIAFAGSCKGYPTTSFLYGLFAKLKTHALARGAIVQGFPMMNIRAADSINYDYMVALPIDKKLPSSGDILEKRLPGRCNLLVTEVEGGPETNKRAFQQMEYYLEDYKLKSPALPFYSLITDRLQEQDTSKWITKIYLPVF